MVFIVMLKMIVLVFLMKQIIGAKRIEKLVYEFTISTFIRNIF
jgi:hypothetical protein